jgi:hypothetical protein
MAFGESIKAYLGLDTAGFKAGLATAESSLSGLAGKLAGAFGLTLGVAGIEAGIRKVVEYGAHVADLSDKFGVNAESLQRLGNAAELHGSSLDGVAKGFNKLEIAQSRALGGSESILRAFSNLGISVDDLKKLSPEQIMMKLGKSSLNAADLVAVLGKNALELRPILEGVGNGSIELGKAIDENLIRKLKEADDTWKKLGQNLKIGFATPIAGGVKWWDVMRSGGKEAFEDLKVSAGQFSDAFKALMHGNVTDAVRHFELMAWSAKQAQLSIEDAADSKSKKASAKAAGAPGAEDQRLKFSLKELADREALPSNAQSLQSWWEGDRARRVQRLQSTARQQAANQDITGAQASLSGADNLRQSINGLSDAEKSVGAFKTALADTNAKLDTLHMDLQQDE